eukprot:799025-Rhodomonas_salina.1
MLLSPKTTELHQVAAWARVARDVPQYLSLTCDDSGHPALAPVVPRLALVPAHPPSVPDTSVLCARARVPIRSATSVPGRRLYCE